jgi:hypothetical protein
MTINDMHPTELVEHRLRQDKANRNKIASDAKSKTDKLSYSNGNKPSSHGVAAKINRDNADDRAIERLSDEAAYWDDLMND